MSYVAAIDQGTTSTRFIVFDRAGEIVSSAQREHDQIYPRPGWVEHDPEQIWQRTQQVIAEACLKAGLLARDIEAVGITNQRETTIVWERDTGKAVTNAIVWQDTRVTDLIARFASKAGPEFFRRRTGLPLSTYFSSLKLVWILENVPDVRQRAKAGSVLFGTVDTYLIWRLTGGPARGIHVTDVTNASRTQLMNLERLTWDEELLGLFDIPQAMLPRICASSEKVGTVRSGPLADVPICGILGDQQAALVGQTCFHPGDAKNTYGTGCFLLMHTGTNPVPSKCGLITTAAYQFANQPACYALEGSIAITGALVQWLRDNLGLIGTSSEVEQLARTVKDNGDVYFVPAFSGLYAPYWKGDARGVIVGLTRYSNRGHLARAALEATAFQTREVVEAMETDSGIRLDRLRVDGGMTNNELLMQFQADILNRPIIRPHIQEITAIGAAYVAGLAAGYFADTEELRKKWRTGRTWNPGAGAEAGHDLYRRWKKAVTRSFGWLD